MSVAGVSGAVCECGSVWLWQRMDETGHYSTKELVLQVVPGSGHGWQLFRVEERRVGAPGGDLRPVAPLDYENPDHRRGFRFRVEVTDMVGEGLN